METIKTFTYKKNGLAAVFARVSPWAKINVTAELLEECELKLHRPNKPLLPELVQFLEEFYSLKEEGENHEYLPSWVLIHPTHGVLAFANPNLGKSVSYKTYAFDYNRGDAATKFLQDKVLVGGSWEESNPIQVKTRKGSID